jgi:CheY-like chemotaxis protein
MENDAALAAVAGMAASPQAELARTCRVLVIEEDPSYRATLTQMIQNRSYPGKLIRSDLAIFHRSISSGPRALRDNPEGFNVVMVVADMQGPGIDGFDFVDHARESHATVRKSRVICSH